MVVQGAGAGPLSAVWIRTVSGPIVRADRLASVSVLYGDGHHVDFDAPAGWRDEPAELIAFFEHLEYGLLLGTCHVRNALWSMHGFMDVYTGCVMAGRTGVIGAVPGTDPVMWALDRFLPSLPAMPPEPQQAPAPPSANGQGVAVHEEQST